MDPHAAPPENQSHIIRNLEICLITFSTVFLIGRLYSRLGYIKNAGLDDAIAALAWILICAQLSMELIAASRWTGRHLWDVPPAQLTFFPTYLQTNEMLFFIGTGLVRLSIVAFLPRLNKNRSVRFSRIILGLATTIIIVTVAFSIYLLTSCKPVRGQKPMTKCWKHENQTIMLCTHQGLSSVFDLCLLCVPIWLVYTHMAYSWRTVKVLLVFSVGLFVFIVGITRFVVMLTVDMNSDPTWNLLYITIWTALEIHVGFWVACFPAFVPLLRFAFKAVLGTNSNGSPPVSNPARGLTVKARKIIRGLSSTGDATASEDGIVTNADGTVRTSGDHEMTNAETWRLPTATTAEANAEFPSHEGDGTAGLHTLDEHNP